ncbi:hypothetical protein IAR55_002255 [Kwoniella newhampshirensis]|uniref:START domain-containing protein n=1 Tax=Kwoniella newhampshirensis TaxID=1651941 RepID=A0AAW0YYV8_9TREE
MRLENLDDGSKLGAAWTEALTSSLTYFRALLSSSSSTAWKPVSVLPLTASATARDSGKSVAKGSSIGKIDASQVRVHRRSGKGGEVFRAVVEVDCGSDVSVDTFRGCLVTPETRPRWDRMVEEAVTLDLLDAHTRVTKTNYQLGWPSSPRDAVTISKTLVDQHTLVDITTSLPRSRHEPAYLRASPPHVRAHVSLLAWCIQLPASTNSPDAPPEGKARITCFWSWNPKGAWAVGGGVPQHLPSLVVGLVEYVRDGSEKVPVLLGYGPDVTVGSVGYDTSRVTLSVGYAIVSGGQNPETEDLRRQIEFGLSSTQSWDVQITVKTQHGKDSASTVWNSLVGQAPTSVVGAAAPKRLILRFAHAQLEPGEELVRVNVSIERTTSATSGVRINGVPVTIEQMQAHIPTRPLLEETASMTGISLRTMSTMSTVESLPTTTTSREGSMVVRRAESSRSEAALKGVASLIRRNYISIHQLNSIDKTLIVFRAEAVFVGVGIWDLFAVISSPGARLVWDKSHDDATLVEDVNELSDLWHIRSKAAWPVALGGARAVASKYDVEAETFRHEYQAAEARRSNSSSTATAFPLAVAVKSGDSESSSLKSMDLPRPVANIECEIRCDADQWANSFAIVIDPPQQAISALRRHRLSPGGGGLWLTVEHDPRLLKDDKVVTTVRRGTPMQGTKTVVTVNGTKIKIDVEDMPEAEVQLLKKQKRGQPSRAPLDQPPALGTLRKKQSTTNLGATSGNTLNSVGALTPASAIAKVAIPFTKWYNVAAETTRAAIIPMATASSVPDTGTTAVDAAVKALGQLARIHTERDGESTSPDAWQPVSDRDGLKIERRTVGHVSEAFPVFRAGRIIEGFTAEEVSASVSSLRRDERFDKPTILQSYGHGLTTSHLVAHTTFPFRGRSMLVATVVARMPDGPPPSPSAHGPHTPLSTIFHASSSNFDPSSKDLDPAKYNPAGLPSGNVILEGWILETIDPYSHEQYAIPSTRCMYVAAVDYSGSMPLSVNNMLNASLPRSLLSIESLLKVAGTPSRARSPPMAVLAPDERSSGPWALDSVATSSTGVYQRNEDDRYTMTVIIQPQSTQPSRDGTLSPTLKHVDSRSSVNTGRSTVIDLGEDIRRGKKDLVVLEVEVGSALVKGGCLVSLQAISLPVAVHNASSDIAIMPLDLPSDNLLEDLPFKCSVVSLTPSVLQSASLDPTSHARHLLKVTLPTTGYDAPISDPLVGPAAPSPRPRWLLDLINDGAVVQLSLRSATSSPVAVTEGQIGSYNYAGKDIPIEDEKRGKHLGLRDGNRQVLPQLVNKDPNSTTLTSLENPLAVDRGSMNDVVEAERRNSIRTALGDAAGDGATEQSEPLAISEIKPPLPLEPRPPNSETSRYAYNFWRYSRLPRFSTSAPLTAKTSPIKPGLTTTSTIHTTGAQTEKGTKGIIFTPMPIGQSTSPSTKSPSSTTGTNVAALITESKFLRPVISVPGLVIACTICLLLGSLLRSLLSEADFVYQHPEGTSLQDEGEHWRELKRLVEIGIGRDRDLIVAIAKRV